MSLTPSGNSEHKKPEFWMACMEAQVWEMKECLAKGDFEHFLVEMADCMSVTLDGIRLLSNKDAMQVFLARFAQNLSKFTPEGLKQAPRDTAWYLAKIEKIKHNLELLSLDPLEGC